MNLTTFLAGSAYILLRDAKPITSGTRVKILEFTKEGKVKIAPDVIGAGLVTAECTTAYLSPPLVGQYTQWLGSENLYLPVINGDYTTKATLQMSGEGSLILPHSFVQILKLQSEDRLTIFSVGESSPMSRYNMYISTASKKDDNADIVSISKNNYILTGKSVKALSQLFKSLTSNRSITMNIDLSKTYTSDSHPEKLIFALDYSYGIYEAIMSTNKTDHLIELVKKLDEVASKHGCDSLHSILMQMQQQ